MNSYYLTSRSKRFYVGFSIFALIIIIGLLIYVSRNTLWIQIYFLGYGLFLIYSLIQKIQKEHIVISEKGIQYHSPGVIFETNWESIEKLSRQWRNGFWHECLLVDNSNISMKKWSFWWSRNIPHPFELFPRKTLIPLSCFSDNWRSSDLGQQIKQYIPRLFEIENKQSA